MNELMKEMILGESKYVEYKLTYTQTLLKTVSAFANYHDGIIVIGVADSGEIMGVEKPDEVRLSIENAINDSIDPKPFFEMEKVQHEEGKTLVLLRVYKGDYTPYTYNKKAYKRMDTSTVQVDRYGYEELILQGRNSSFEELPVDAQDLNFRFLMTRLKQETGIHYLTEDLLVALRLRASGRYNNAAMLISDENSAKNSEIHLIAYKDDSVMEIKDKQTLKNMSVLEQYEKCMDFYVKHVNVGEVIDGPYRKTIAEIPLVAYREAIANMIVHRDYSREGAARVEVFSNRIEVVSPGGLPIGITEEEYLQGKVSVARNRILADIFLRLKIIEKLATGIRRIKEYYKDSKTKPQFLVSDNSILVLLPKVDLEEEAVPVDTTGRIALLPVRAQQIYAMIRDHGPISRSEIESEIGIGKSQTVQLIGQLRDMNLIAQIKKGRSTKYVVASPKI
jgi:ATP-dependent DNA helicase RecG